MDKEKEIVIISIRERIKAEHRKHRDIDGWEEILARKIYATYINDEEEIKCVECGKYFKKKEIIMKGDIDTCDDCLCPE
jgi:hypothetical protein